MKAQPVRTDEDLENAFDTYADKLYGISLTMLKSKTEAEDAVQETFIKYYQSDKQFDSEEHRKAWLITVCVNYCKNILSFWNRHRHESLEEWHEFSEDMKNSEIFDALMKLPEKHRIVMILHYVEEYSVRETAAILNISESAVKMRLQKGRTLLRSEYGEE